VAWHSYEWAVKKYEKGQWEKLVDPTLHIAIWLKNHKDSPDINSEVQKAIAIFQKERRSDFPNDELVISTSGDIVRLLPP
jgi:hypothetical protein